MDFSSLKVIELAGVLAGPSVGMFFSELGAEVIKIENSTTGGDVTRKWKVPSEDPNNAISAYFCSVNYKKKHLFYNLKDDADLTAIKDLIKDADILLTNFKSGYDEKYGLDYNSLSKHNPQLIKGSISGFTHQEDRVAFDLILQAESGIMSMNGQPDGPPTKMPIALIDVLAGHQLKEGILCALLERMTTGKGKEVKVSLFDAALASLANQATNWLMAGHNPQRLGSKHPNIAPYGEIFETEDGILITFAIGSNIQFENLNQILGGDWHSNKFSTNKDRVIHRKDLEKLIAKEVRKHSFNDLSQACLTHQIPMAQIKTVKEVFENEYTKNLILEEEIDGQVTKRVKTVVFN